MRFSIKYADKIVGTLVALALVILIFVIFMLGKNQRWFRKDYQYKTYLSSASGLSRNMAVHYKGFAIGNVKNFVLSEDDSVEVSFTIFEEYNDRVREGSVVEMIVSPIGLGSSFQFYPGRGENLLEEGSIIPDVNSYFGKQMIASGLASKEETQDSISNILNQVIDILDTVEIAIKGKNDGGTSELAQIIQNINNAVYNLDLITRGLASPDGTIMRALDGGGSFYSGLSASINSISSILNDLERTTGVIPAQLPIALTDLNIALRQIQDVLTAAANNPLLRGGIPQRNETGPGGASSRDLEF